jgi:cytochrome P450
VSESVRLEQSEYLHRRATRDFKFRGVVIPKGWLVHVCIHESHRDPQVFEEPNVYNPDRFLESSYPADYAPFGIGDRSCIGVPLTREISRRFLLHLAQYEMVVVQDGPRELSAQRHWAPSSRLRLTLDPR